VEQLGMLLHHGITLLRLFLIMVPHLGVDMVGISNVSFFVFKGKRA
jgi:hypothetical protein